MKLLRTNLFDKLLTHLNFLKASCCFLLFRDLHKHEIENIAEKNREKKASSPGGLEPPTFRLTAERANRLRHGDIHRYSLIYLHYYTFTHNALPLKSASCLCLKTSSRANEFETALVRSKTDNSEKQLRGRPLMNAYELLTERAWSI